MLPPKAISPNEISNLTSYNFRCWCGLPVLACLIISGQTFAQSDPGNFDRIIEIPQDDNSLYGNPGPNVQVNLRSGGRVEQAVFETGSELNVYGGQINERVVADSGSTFNIVSGTIEGVGFQAKAGSTINVLGGSLLGTIDQSAGNLVSLSGGAVSHITSTGSNTVDFFGGEFKLNGLAAGSTASVDDINNNLLTGTLTDGSVFIFSGTDNDRIKTANLNSTVLPAADLTPMFVNVRDGGPQGLREGQTLTVQAEGILRQNFNAVGSTVNIEDGGWIGRGFKSAFSEVNVDGYIDIDGTALAGSTINVTGGALGRNFFVREGGHLNMSDGFLYTGFTVSGGLADISGGEVDNGNVEASGVVNVSADAFVRKFNAFNGGTINVSSGMVDDLYVKSGGTANITGGLTLDLIVEGEGRANVTSGLVRNFRAESSTLRPAVATISGGLFDTIYSFEVGERGNVTLEGGEFLLNGSVAGSSVSLNRDNGNLLTGTLADGSSIILSGTYNARVESMKLNTVALAPADTTPIVVNLLNQAPAKGLRAGQTLTVQSFGTIENDFVAIGSTVNLEGGQIERLSTAFTTVNAKTGNIGDIYAFQGSVLNFRSATLSGVIAAFNAEINLGQMVPGSGSFRSTIDRIAATDHTHINLSPGGTISALALRDESVLDMTGGVLGGTTIYENSYFNISGGGTGGLVVYGNVAMTGGAIGDNARFDDGAVVNLEGGSIGSRLELRSGATINFSGGTIGSDLRIWGGSTINMSGGKFAGFLNAAEGSEFNLIGSNFTLNGEEIEGLITNSPFEILQRGGVLLAGTFASGETFSYSIGDSNLNRYRFSPNARLTVTQIATAVPEPSALFLWGFSGLAMAAKRRRRPNNHATHKRFTRMD